MEAQFTDANICLNVLRAQWADHQKADEYLGEIYMYLQCSSDMDPASFPKQIRTRAQSYRLVNGILVYRSIREVGRSDGIG